MKVLAYGRVSALLVDWADIVVHPDEEPGYAVVSVRIGEDWARRRVLADRQAIVEAIEAETNFLGH